MSQAAEAEAEAMRRALQVAGERRQAEEERRRAERTAGPSRTHAAPVGSKRNRGARPAQDSDQV